MNMDNDMHTSQVTAAPARRMNARPAGATGGQSPITLLTWLLSATAPDQTLMSWTFPGR